MCDDQTKQTYIVLRAFSKVSGILTPEKVKISIQETLSPLGLDEVEQLGPLTFDEIVDDLLRSGVANLDSQRRYSFSDTADSQRALQVLEGFVQKGSPELIMTP